MKKPLNGWQIALLLIGMLAVCFAVIIGSGYLLSKAVWLERLDGVELTAGWLWIVLYGVHLLLSAKWFARRFHISKKADLFFQLTAFICLTVRLTVSTAFRFAGIQ